MQIIACSLTKIIHTLYVVSSFGVLRSAGLRPSPSDADCKKSVYETGMEGIVKKKIYAEG